jgi:hypothetical protein
MLTDGDRTGGGGGSDDSARLRPAVGAGVVFANNILQPGGTWLMGCFDAVVRARRVTAFGSVRAGRCGTRHCAT